MFRFYITLAASLIVASISFPSFAAASPWDRPTAALEEPIEITVYRSPTCGCCKSWIDHLRRQGFRVNDNVESNMSRIKDRLGVPPAARSCHTARVGEYVIEGHVPAGDIKKILSSNPRISGLAVPGMVTGSPGMEVGNRRDPFTVISFETDGALRPFKEYRNY